MYDKKMNFKPKNKGIFKGPKAKMKRKKMFGKKESKTTQLDREIKSVTEKYDQIDPADCKTFSDFPLSDATLQGLKTSKFETPTDIQRESLLLALQGHDVLGAAKTGSGKTLAFLIPVIECLFRNKWSRMDGLGALIISPTRELAYQTFEVLKLVGKFHNFSAGLVIGGKPLREEVGRINQTNIVICTPGRLLQHMDETAYFTADSLQMLVLDEADRILDMGFQQSMNAIIENLPPERQTLLFSATQTKSVKDLARLSLTEPMFVSVHENADKSTPNRLEQNYVVCELQDKINLLWSFLKNHLKAKILVFLSSCKQVRYITEAMNMLRPGIPLMCLHGDLPQLRRVAVYNQFLWKQHACLFATDIAARGLDFPSINWVLQLDCPEDANTYIHRAGRTARYEKDGEALLVVLPSEEEEMVKQLQDKKIPIEKIRVNDRRFVNIQHKLEANCASDVNLKEMAQRAFGAYLKSVFLMSNKKVFNVHSLDAEAFARSLGLAITPKLRFLKKDQQRLEEKEKLLAAKQKQKLEKSVIPEPESEDSSEKENESDSENSDSDKSDSNKSDSNQSDSGSDDLDQKRLQRLKKSGKNESFKFDNGDSDGEDDDDDDDDDLFKVHRNVDIKDLETEVTDKDENGEENQAKLEDLLKNSRKLQRVRTKKQLAELLRKKNISINTKIKFKDDAEGQDSESDEGAGGGIDIQTAKIKMEKEDLVDKETYRQKIKQDHKEKRMKLKEERRQKREQRRQELGLDDKDEEEVEVKLPSDEEDDEREADPLSFIPDPDDVYDGNGNQSDDDDPLSFIPDPDKVYGKKGNQSEDSDSSEYDSDGPSRNKKRKTVLRADSDSDESSDDDNNDDDDNDDSDDNDDDDDEDVDSSEDDDISYSKSKKGQSLKTDEEIALMLLKGKR